MSDDVIDMATEEMDNSVDAFRRELKSVRTGRARTALLDGIRVDYYGQSTPLNQVATLSAPEPSLLVIKPWDPSSIETIEKAIQTSELGLTPNNDGKIIRLPVPPLTEERRQQLVKQVKSMAEEARISVRNHRREANDMVKTMEQDGEISEDRAHRLTENIQKLTDSHIDKIDELLEEKSEEIMAF